VTSAGAAVRPAAPAVADLCSLSLVRERCASILDAIARGDSAHFTLDRARLADAADVTAAVTRERYPDLRIPYHSRWRHFEAGGVDRAQALDRALAGASRAELARSRIDLAVVSVLLDAGAGPRWRYVEPRTGATLSRSEGLGVASLHAFLAGAFSARPDAPCRVDASALLALDARRLAAIFQVRDDNPLVGLGGRVALLQRLGRALADPVRFGGAGRPGALYDLLTGDDARAPVSAVALVNLLLARLSDIWPTGNAQDGVALGDTWRHPAAGGIGPTAGWVPFHKLTQWLAYSLLEPFEWSGARVTDTAAMTGLPEYRNGGLMLDTGVLALRDPAAAGRAWPVGSELIVEWRAATVVLLDELAPLVRQRLGHADLPLACILEGGTWAAGRKVAAARRDGAPPLTLDSDGTVF